MADNGFGFLKDILFTPASVRAQNNAESILQQQQASQGAARVPVVNEINRLRGVYPNASPQQLVSELMKSDTFMQAFTGDPETFNFALDAIKATSQPGADPYTLGQGDTRYDGNNQPVAFGAGVNPETGGINPPTTDKIKNFEYFTQGLSPEEQATLRAAQLSDDPSSKDATISRLVKIGWPEEQAIKFAEGVIKQVNSIDKITGAPKVFWLDQSDPANPQLFELPEQQMPQGGLGAQALPQQPAVGAAAVTGPRRSQPENEAYAVNVAKKTAAKLGVDPLDVLTTFGYETGGTYDPWQGGPTTKWGKHRGLIQWGETQARQYGIRPNMTEDEQAEATARYLADRGVRPGMSQLQIYAAINGGNVNAVNASDEAAGGAPGTVTDKVKSRQFAQHRERASQLLGNSGGSPAAGLNMAQDINNGQPSGRRLAEAFVTTGPVGSASGAIDTLGQIINPASGTPDGATANQNYTYRQQMIQALRGAQADLGKGNNVSIYEAKQFEEVIKNLESPSAQTSLGAAKQVLTDMQAARQHNQGIFSDESQSVEERKAALTRVNMLDKAMQKWPSMEDLDAVLQNVRGGGAGNPIGNLIKQGAQTLQQLVPTAQDALGTAEGVAQPLLPQTGLDPNSVSKMTLEQIKKFAADDAAIAALTPEQREAFRARLMQLKGGK